MAISLARSEFAPLLFAGEWEHGLAVAAGLGYDAVEVSVRDPHAQLVGDVAEAVRRNGLALSTVATGQSYYSDSLTPTSDDPAVRAELRRRMMGIADFASPWKAPIIIGGIRGKLVGDAKAREGQRLRAIEAIHAYAEYAQTVGVPLAIEPINRYETNFVNTVPEALELVEQIAAENVGVIADTFHMNIEEVSLADALRLAGPCLEGVHFVDSNRRAAGQGHIDFPRLIDVLREIGYVGYVTAEILPLPDSRTAAASAIGYFHSL
jgi:sugar phosphate isomerase/epimerase